MINDLIVLFILIAIIVAIAWYLVRAKKRGQTCIGCPYAKHCAGQCNCQSESQKQ